MNGIVLICDGPDDSNLGWLNFNGPFGNYDGKAQQYCPQGFTGAMASIQGQQVSLIIMWHKLGFYIKVSI